MTDKPQMVSMERTPEDMAKAMMPMAGAMGPSQYPYGLCISLTHDELSKLGLDADCEVGDMVHLFAMAKVTSVTSNASESMETCRVELQITDLAVEDEDNEEADKGNSQKRASKRYGSDDADEEDAEEEA